MEAKLKLLTSPAKKLLPWEKSCRSSPYFRDNVHELFIQNGYELTEKYFHNWHYTNMQAGVKVEFEGDMIYVWLWTEEIDRLPEWASYVRFTNIVSIEALRNILKAYFITL